ncbi:MAG TPA: serine hydrolase domain-containing protein [Thermoanaerobaculia bacterium]|nr:serine hydrolase domain-containing protein [Thermoanaerobaculia bacterium]
MGKRLLLFLLILSALRAHGQMDTRLAEAKVPAVGIGIIRDGKLREVRVYGELQKGVPAPYDTIWNVASLTKPVVTMLTLKLVAEGKWQLDEPLAKYWIDPDLAADPRARLLTTRHVLTHTTGFPNWRWNDASKKLNFHADPGTKFGYSGEGFEYLRKALEKKFGKSLSELSKANIFDPLGMRDTQHAWDARTDESRFARWHDAEGRNAYTDHRITRANGADNLLTTIEDYGRFGAWIVSGAGLPPALFEDMVKPQPSMGLGWEVHSGFPNGEYALIHSGSDEGVKTVIILLPKSKQGLVVFTNGDNGFNVIGPVVVESLALGKEIMSRAK